MAGMCIREEGKKQQGADSRCSKRKQQVQRAAVREGMAAMCVLSMHGKVTGSTCSHPRTGKGPLKILAPVR